MAGRNEGGREGGREVGEVTVFKPKWEEERATEERAGRVAGREGQGRRAVVRTDWKRPVRCTHTQTDRQTDGQTDRQTDICIHTYIHTSIHTYIHTYIHTCVEAEPLVCPGKGSELWLAVQLRGQHSATRWPVMALRDVSTIASTGLAHMYTYIHTYIRQTERQRDRETDGQQTDRQTDHTYM